MDAEPDLVFAGTVLSGYLHKPGVKHLQAAKHTLRYVSGTLNLKIRYTLDLDGLHNRGHDLNVLYGLSDSDLCLQRHCQIYLRIFGASQ